MYPSAMFSLDREYMLDGITSLIATSWLSPQQCVIWRIIATFPLEDKLGMLSPGRNRGRPEKETNWRFTSSCKEEQAAARLKEGSVQHQRNEIYSLVDKLKSVYI